MRRFSKSMERWAYVLRYHRPAQLARRLHSRLRRHWMGVNRAIRFARLQPPTLALSANPDFEAITRRRLASNRVQGFDGQVRILNEPMSFEEPIDWRLESKPHLGQLGRFHLHYQEYLIALVAQWQRKGEQERLHSIWRLVHEWIVGNELGDPACLDDAWHPYCISRRLVAWQVVWSAAPPATDLKPTVLESMWRQARFLEDSLETDIGGNHLIENARALALTGSFLDCPDSERWKRLGFSLAKQELSRQLLPSGEHFERSPTYHCRVLEAILDCLDVLGPGDDAIQTILHEAAVSMAKFVASIRHPDGETPLFGDSTFEETPTHLLERVFAIREGEAPAEPRLGMNQVRAEEMAVALRGSAGASPSRSQSGTITSAAQRVGDYWTFRSGEDFLVFDAGAVGADDLPAHAHCDLLGLEASIVGHRLFVDTGVFHYQAGEMRCYCRSTAAHNVLQIDDAEQCDMWGEFRMGYRGYPFEFETGVDKDLRWARAFHNAYRRSSVPRVGRWLACQSDGPWFCVDLASGAGTHTITSRLHLHPHVSAQRLADTVVRLRIGAAVQADLVFLVAGDLSFDDGWYCPDFGVRIRTTVLRWSVRLPLPAACGWMLTRWSIPTDEIRATLIANGADSILIWRDAQSGERRELRPFGANVQR